MGYYSSKYRVLLAFSSPRISGEVRGSAGEFDATLQLWYYVGMLSIDDDKIKQFESDLKTFAARAYPFATKSTLNSAAFEARSAMQGNIRRQMVTRNKFTEKSVRVETVRGLNVGRQFAIVGSIAPYMETQEFGGTKRKGGKTGTPIPTTAASGEGEGMRPRRRPVPRSRALGRISLRNNKIKAVSRKQKNFLKVKLTAKSGRKFVFLDLDKHPGIYRVTGGVRRPQVKLMWDMSKESVVIPRNPTLQPAVRRAERRLPKLYEEALVFQLKRQGLFKG